MKIITTLLLLIICGTLSAQETLTKPSQNAITTQFAGTGGRLLSLNYERILLDKKRLSVKKWGLGK